MSWTNDFASHTPYATAGDARRFGQGAAVDAESVALETKDVATEAIAAGEPYAQNALDHVGRKIDSAKSQFARTTQYLTTAIQDEPIKSMVITAGLSAAITALLLLATRNDSYPQ